MKRFRMGQRVCKVAWRNGRPYVVVSRVVRLTKTTYYVEGKKEYGQDWCASWREAIDSAYECFLRDAHGLLIRGWGDDQSTWEIKDTVRAVCRIRRLERKIQGLGWNLDLHSDRA